jgi:hypothetical protein
MSKRTKFRKAKQSKNKDIGSLIWYMIPIIASI